MPDKFYISNNGSDESGSGTEDDPYLTIQAGINIAEDGDTILVAAGNYIENINFNGKNISVIGEDQLTTIIDGWQYDRVVTFENNETNLSLLKNFTIQNGICFDESSGGGGIYVFNATRVRDTTSINGESFWFYLKKLSSQ